MYVCVCVHECLYVFLFVCIYATVRYSTLLYVMLCCLMFKLGYLVLGSFMYGRAYMCTHFGLCLCICMYVFMSLCMSVRIYVCVRVCVYVCMYVGMYVCFYVWYAMVLYSIAVYVTSC